MSLDISFVSGSLSSETLSTLERIFDTELGTSYDLSLLFCDNTLSRSLNATYRDKDYSTNILSFPLSDTSGEVIIDLEQCLNEHEQFDRDFENFVLFLFIHGVLHLKGYDHGDPMEHEEERIRDLFHV